MPYLLALLVSVLTAAQIPQPSTGTTAWNLGAKFASDVPGKITALRYYRWQGDQGPHDGQVWNSAGTKLAEVTFVDETPSGWQEQALSAPLAMTAGADFVVSVGHPAGSNFPILPQGFAAPLAEGHLTYKAGAFVGAVGAFPGSDSVGDYFRRVVFVPDVQPVLTVGSAAVRLDEQFGSILVEGFEPGATVTVTVTVTDGKSTARASGPLTIPAGESK